MTGGKKLQCRIGGNEVGSERLDATEVDPPAPGTTAAIP
jgi:hypothetical protein